ncbi:hypothetical protein Ato02nite_042080 [Paractinoplanes toevensis]|uniref:Uncharacterized protein n=1 Tax=Paractinoplanes toevensis TaxID=571911 RepID=A0A919TBB3_9ACTN|nr:hypothetical protein Ato02nite_042080 [Actinoplanes toevensis]
MARLAVRPIAYGEAAGDGHGCLLAYADDQHHTERDHDRRHQAEPSRVGAGGGQRTVARGDEGHRHVHGVVRGPPVLIVGGDGDLHDGETVLRVVIEGEGQPQNAAGAGDQVQRGARDRAGTGRRRLRALRPDRARRVGPLRTGLALRRGIALRTSLALRAGIAVRSGIALSRRGAGRHELRLREQEPGR